MKHYDFDIRVAYADTDRMGVVYYGNYLALFERGRTEFLRSVGARYRDMEEKRHLFMPVIEAHVDYFAPARYDELIQVRTSLQELGAAHVVFGSEIYNEAKRLVARGRVKLAVVNARWKPTRLPPEIRRLLEPHLA
ncbi:MAG: thioesterase family protein [Elusimicrobiota bacterium]|jgi:acyl-CoA thioester hydrolase